MSSIDRLISKFVPHSCVGCAVEGSLLCNRCFHSLKRSPIECYRCRQPSASHATCVQCRHLSDVSTLLIAYEYRGTSKDLLWKLKSNGAQAVAYLVANHMKRLLSTDRNLLLVPIPTASTRVRQRGYDQARLITAQLARQTGLHWATCLVRQGQAHQVGAGRDQRLEQLHDAFRVTRPYLVRDAHILLVDDVITTGATFEIAARELMAAGAASVSAMAFARPALRIKSLREG